MTLGVFTLIRLWDIQLVTRQLQRGALSEDTPLGATHTCISPWVSPGVQLFIVSVFPA